MGQLDGAIAGQITEAFKGEQIEVEDSSDPISGPVPGQFNQLAMDGGARRQHAARSATPFLPNRTCNCRAARSSCPDCK
jgi:hypothetical protein